MTFRRLVLSLLLVAAALASVPAINWIGGELAAALRLPPGGTPRLAWDLGWLLLSAWVAVFSVARWSPLWPRGLALALGGLLFAASVWAAWNMGGDFPGWFVTGVLVGTALAATWGLHASLR
ncbi:MAG TPA: hypothetical protein VFQ84_02615 [Arenimonas sp.]|uniref:hypothetical protein n=1 Tax=Arenimonas sp. TaxID=1872635 RepID=UPI002D7EB661|nr:hypothetical protein [Arenimonas sp.]HEU0152220.1 hypothetical protein [Arenimonas sp.]